MRTKRATACLASAEAPTTAGRRGGAASPDGCGGRCAVVVPHAVGCEVLACHAVGCAALACHAAACAALACHAGACGVLACQAVPGAAGLVGEAQSSVS